MKLIRKLVVVSQSRYYISLYIQKLIFPALAPLSKPVAPYGGVSFHWFFSFYWFNVTLYPRQTSFLVKLK